MCCDGFGSFLHCCIAVYVSFFCTSKGTIYSLCVFLRKPCARNAENPSIQLILRLNFFHKHTASAPCAAATVVNTVKSFDVLLLNISGSVILARVPGCVFPLAKKWTLLSHTCSYRVLQEWWNRSSHINPILESSVPAYTTVSWNTHHRLHTMMQQSNQAQKKPDCLFLQATRPAGNFRLCILTICNHKSKIPSPVGFPSPPCDEFGALPLLHCMKHT